MEPITFPDSDFTMDKYGLAIHDLLNHLRNQPVESSGWDMYRAAERFVAQYDLENEPTCIPPKLQAYSPQPKEPIMTDDAVEAAVEPTAPEIDQSPVPDPISLEADAIAAAEAIKKLAVDAFEEI